MRKARPYYFFAIVILPLAIYLRNPQVVVSFHSATATVIKPVLTASSQLSLSILDGKEGWDVFWKTFQKNLKDQEKLEQIESELTRLEEVRRENQRLLKMLTLKETIPSKSMASRVIGWDPSLIRKSILIDKGKSHKIRLDMPVMVSEGLVGRVVEVAPSTSKVLLLTDPEMRVGALTGTSRSQGIVAGNGSSVLTMNYLELDSSVAVGEEVLSSGGNGLFPKGLRIGKITSIEKTSNGLYLEAMVEPDVQFSKLEEVLCLESSPAK